jgi:ligand-binding SRPBCC domain-containing protein
VSVRFQLVNVVDAAPEVLFDLSLDIDLHVRSMAASNERAVAGVTSGRIGPGQDVTWRARHFGVPLTMSSRITAYDRPARFVDEQIRGPFSRFRHEHLFERVGGGTRMTDRVEFAAPLGPLGRVVEKLVLARYLERLIAERNRELLGAIGRP